MKVTTLTGFFFMVEEGALASSEGRSSDMFGTVPELSRKKFVASEVFCFLKPQGTSRLDVHVDLPTVTCSECHKSSRSCQITAECDRIKYCCWHKK